MRARNRTPRSKALWGNFVHLHKDSGPTLLYHTAPCSEVGPLSIWGHDGYSEDSLVRQMDTVERSMLMSKTPRVNIIARRCQEFAKESFSPRFATLTAKDTPLRSSLAIYQTVSLGSLVSEKDSSRILGE